MNPLSTPISLYIRLICSFVLLRILAYPSFNGIVVVDEAYVDFSPPGSSAVPLLSEFDNIVIMQTLSKGFGLAGIR